MTLYHYLTRVQRVSSFESVSIPLRIIEVQLGAKQKRSNPFPVQLNIQFKFDCVLAQTGLWKKFHMQQGERQVRYYCTRDFAEIYSDLFGPYYPGFI